MTSDEIPGYVDLSLYDVTEEELVQRAITDAQTKLPEWRPREGNTEVVLQESLALIVAELAYAINRAPATTLEGLLALYGLIRDPGSPARGHVEFTMSAVGDYTIPAGTTVRLTVPTTGEEFDFTTDADVSVVGSLYVDTDVTAAEVGVSPNGTISGTVVELIDAVPYVESAAFFDEDVSGGVDPETDQEFYDRGAALLSRLVTTLVLPEHFTAAALENPDVGRAFTIDLYNPDLAGNPGDHAGFVTVALATDAGAAVTGGVKTTVEAALEAACHAGLDVKIIDPTVTAVNVTTTVIALPGYDHTVVSDAIEEALNGYLNPVTWGWSSWVFRNELITLISNVPGVDRVADLDVPGGDLALPGHAPLASPGAFSIAVS